MKLKFISVFMVIMFLTAGLFAQRQVSTAEAFVKKAEQMQKKEVKAVHSVNLSEKSFEEKENPNQSVPISFGTTLVTPKNSKGVVYLTTSGGTLYSEKWVDITTEADGAGTVVWQQGDGETYGDGQGLLTDEPLTLTDGETYYINCYDRYDDSWDGTTYEVRTAISGGGVLLANNGGDIPDDGNDDDTNSSWESRDLEIESSEAFVIPIPDANDLAVTAVTPSFVLSGNSATPVVTVSNLGTAEQISYNVSVAITNATTGDFIQEELDKNFTDAIASGSSFDCVMADAWTPTDLGTYSITATVTIADDANTADNVLVQECGVGEEWTSENFDASTDLPFGWTTETNNREWGVVASGDANSDPNFLKIGYNSLALDDWVYTCGSNLIAAKIYLVEFYTIKSSYNEKLEFSVGSSAGSASMTTLWDSEIDGGLNEEMTKISMTYTPTIDGVYYFGWHGYSNANQYWMGIDDASIQELLDFDLAPIAIDYTHDFVMVGDDVTIGATIKNYGALQQTGNEITLNVDGMLVETVNITSLDLFDTEDVSFTWTATEGRHTFEVVVATDDNATNDSYSIESVVVAEGQLYEGFEGTLDGWSATNMDIYNGDWAGDLLGNSITENGTYTSTATTPKVVLTGTKATEELNFYAHSENESFGEYRLDLKYSADGVAWTYIEEDVAVSYEWELFSYDLSSIPAGEYYLGFDITGTALTFFGSLYQTYIFIDNVVAPTLVPTYTVTFVVEDESNNPVENALVEFDGGNFSGMTDANGIVQFSDNYTDDYSFEISKDSYVTNSGDITVTGTYSETFTLLGTYTSTFTIVDADDSPIEGALVDIDGGTYTGITDVDGVAEFLLANGDYNIEVSNLLYETYTGVSTISVLDTYSETISLDRTYTVTFSVTDDNTGVPIQGVVINTNGQELAPTDVNGETELFMLPDTYTLTATADYFDEVDYAYTTYTTTTTVDFTMSAMQTYTVTFLVTDGTTPIDGALVTVIDGGGIETYSNTVTDGTAEFQLLTGEADYTVTMLGYFDEMGTTYTISSTTYSETVEVILTAQSNDATLASLSSDNGVLSPVFASGTFIYQIELPYGTTTVPTLTYATTHVNATTDETTANVVPGTTSILVTAEDGIAQNTYTVEYTVALNNETEILTYSIPEQTGTTVIDAALYTVDLVVPFGTDVTALVATFTLSDGATATDQESTVTTNNFTTGSVVYSVVAEDGTTNQDWTVNVEVEQATTYEVIFDVEAGTGAISATVDGTTIMSGDDVIEGSEVIFTATPDALWEVSDWYLAGTTVGSTDLAYTIASLDADTDVTVEFDLIEAINELNSNISVYPNPSNGLFTVSVNGTYNLQVIDITGKVISTQEITNTENININEAGIYMLRLTNNVETLNYKVIVK